MDAAQVQALVDAIVAAAAAVAAGNATAAAVAPQPAVVAPFALLPGASSAAPLDWNKTEAIKLFHKAIFALDTKFDMKEEGLRMFIEQIRERSRIYNWEALLTVQDTAGTPRYMLNYYGMVTIENCQAHALTHVGPAMVSRMAQDSMMLFQFLMNSLTDGAKLAVLADKGNYYINDVPSGVCFLKVIIGRSSVDTNAKVSMLRKRIAKLAETMKNEYKGNVREFNIYASQQRDHLLSRGEAVPELLTHLFDAYLNGVHDEKFHRYVESYQNKHDDGIMVDPDALMKNALVKYDTIMQCKEQAGESEHRIMALTAEGKEMSDGQKFQALVAKLQAYFTQTGMSNKKGNNNGNGKKAIPAWKKEAPGANDPKVIVKTVNDKKKTFNWCPHHQMWCIHLPKDCTYKQDSAGNSDKNNAADPKLVLNKALLAFLDQDVEE